MRYTLLSIFFVAASLTSFAQKSEIFAPEGLAIHGYDPVAILKESKTIEGLESLSHTWKGATWRFASRQNLEAFKSDPEKYAPQYGGYCAYGMSRGYKASTEIDTWSIVNNKLYFNYNRDVKKEWEKERDSRIKTADENWKTVKDHE